MAIEWITVFQFVSHASCFAFMVLLVGMNATLVQILDKLTDETATTKKVMREYFDEKLRLYREKERKRTRERMRRSSKTTEM